MPDSPTSASTAGASAARSMKSSIERISCPRPRSSLAMVPDHFRVNDGQSAEVSSFPAPAAGRTVAGMTTIDYVTSLAEGFSGLLLTPDDAGYDAARTIHNGLIDKRPALIARCLNTADVVD